MILHVLLQTNKTFAANFFPTNDHTGSVAPPVVCDRDLLYANQTFMYEDISIITGIPLRCFDSQYTAFCNDGTNDPSSATTLCSLYGYYGKLAFRHTVPFKNCSSLLQIGIFHCELGGGMYVYDDTFSVSVPAETVFYNNFSCPFNSLDLCTATELPFCDSSPLILTCYNFTGRHYTLTNTKITCSNPMSYDWW